MTINRFITLSIMCVVFSSQMNAQRIVGELETNSDGTMMQSGDSTSNGKKKEKKLVPNDVRAWTVDDIYGNTSPTYVDTLTALFTNDNLAEGRTGHYNSLSNLGSPRISRIFMERDETPQFIFTQPYDQFYVSPDKLRFYNTKSPFMNITYNFCGTKQTGDDHVKIIYTNNVGKKLNFGGIFDYMYGQGFYDNQSTSFMNASFWTSYISDKYDFHFSYQHNFMKEAESGGIIDERDITNPEEQTYTYATNDIPVYLNDTWNRQEHDVLFFNHHYNLGFYHKEYKDSIYNDSTKTAYLDSTKYTSHFVPVARLFHTLKMQNMKRYYKAYEETDGYHTYTYLPGDSTNDRTKNLSIKNIFGLSLCEGFNKWAAFGINAYIGYEYRHFTLTDNTVPYTTFPYYSTYTHKYKEHNVFAGGQIIRKQGKTFHYNVDAEFSIGGEDIGSFEINGHGEVNVPVFGDTAQLAINAYIKNTNPSFYYRHYHSKHAWWDKETDKEFRQRVEGVLTIPHTDTKIKVGFENIKNYAYFENNGAVLSQDTISNNVMSRQYNGTIQIVSATLEQNLKLGILHFDNELTYQSTSNKRILPLPTLSTYHNLYIQFLISKVLRTQIGADMKYFTEYYAPAYSPVIGMYTIQNENNYVNIGNYPLISVYANFALKRSRFYIQYYHANQGTGRYFWSPGYPMNPATLRFGISWNFYD